MAPDRRPRHLRLRADALGVRRHPRPHARAAARAARQLTGPITIPESDEEEFFGDFFPILRNTITVTAGEGIDLPKYHPPAGRLTLTYSTKDRLKLAWAFRYFEPRGVFPFGPGADRSAANKERTGRRDPQWKERLGEAIARAWPQ